MVFTPWTINMFAVVLRMDCNSLIWRFDKIVNLLCIRRTCPLVLILRNSCDKDIRIRGLNNSRTKSINSRHAITLFNFKDGPRYHQLSSIYLWYFIPWGGYTNFYYPLRILHYSFIRLITYESGSGKPWFSFGHYNRSYPALNWDKLWDFQTVGPIINTVIIVVLRSKLRWLSFS